MISIRQSITINRPVEDVFAFMTEAGNIFKYSRGTEEIRQLTREPLGVGARYEIISNFMGQRVPTVLEVTEYVPNVRIRTSSLQGPFDVTGITTFEPRGENTVVTVETDVRPKGFWKLVAPLLPSILRRRSEREYATLRQVLEESFHLKEHQMDVLEISKAVVAVQP